MKCPFHAIHTIADNSVKSNKDWWPNQLNLKVLHTQSANSNPRSTNFNYAAEHMKLDLSALKRKLESLMPDSQEWWPADFGNYGPFFVRMT